MAGKLGLLLLFLQLWHSALPNKTSVAFSASSFKSNFTLQIDNKLYHVETNSTATWYKAAHICRQMGGNLLNIESCNEMDAILAIIPIARYWISPNCLAGKREFISIATGEPITYARWNPGEPNNVNGDEFCGELDGTGLNDNACGRLRKYICEAKIMY